MLQWLGSSVRRLRGGLVMPVAAGLRDAAEVRLLGTEAERRVSDAGRGRFTRCCSG